ncbi:MAG: hypothetical protein ACFE88_16760 [Candidatus Hermodarchaeota archaeon]
MLVGIPIIGLDFVSKSFRETSKYLFLDEKYILIVKNEQELTKLIKKITYNEVFRGDYQNKIRKNTNKFVFYDFNKSPIKAIYDFIRDKIHSQNSTFFQLQKR